MAPAFPQRIRDDGRQRFAFKAPAMRYESVGEKRNIVVMTPPLCRNRALGTDFLADRLEARRHSPICMLISTQRREAFPAPPRARDSANQRFAFSAIGSYRALFSFCRTGVFPTPKTFFRVALPALSCFRPDGL
jgi:hypothetical protein